MECGVQSIYFELIKGVPAAIVALLIGFLASFIAWRQYATARAKLKLDLFEKRYAIFEITWAYLSACATQDSTQEITGPAANFHSYRPQASFLFGSEIEVYLDLISKRKAELDSLDRRLRIPGSTFSPEESNKHTDLALWFSNEAIKGVKMKFSPWLSFEAWK